MGASVALPTLSQTMSASIPNTASPALDRDAELMLRVRDGDTGAFTQLLERHRGAVVGFMYRMVQNRGVAEELAQTSSLIGAAYSIVFHWIWGRTLGKMALQIRVVSMDGGPLSFGQSVGRYFATFLSALILGIGFIMAGVRPDKRALHDLLAGTRVEHL